MNILNRIDPKTLERRYSLPFNMAPQQPGVAFNINKIATFGRCWSCSQSNKHKNKNETVNHPVLVGFRSLFHLD